MIKRNALGGAQMGVIRSIVFSPGGNESGTLQGMKRWILYSIFAYAVIGFACFFLYPYLIAPLLSSSRAVPLPESSYNLAFRLFASNSFVCYLAIVSGAFYGWLPMLILVQNSVRSGAFLGLLSAKGWPDAIFRLPHLLVENPALVLCCGLGMWLGSFAMEGEKKFRTEGLIGLKAWGQEIAIPRTLIATRIFLVFVLPALAFAAVIEAFVSRGFLTGTVFRLLRQPY